MRTAPSHAATPAFTVVELLFALVIGSMVAMAAAALLMAVRMNWQNASSQTPKLAAPRAATRIQTLARSARYLGWAGDLGGGAGSAAFLWASDDEVPGKMNLFEIQLIHFDAASKTLNLWHVPRQAANALLECHYPDMDKADDVAAFKKVNNVVRRVLLNNVMDFDVARRDVDSTTCRPILEYVVKAGDSRGSYAEYRTAALRSPGEKP